MHAEARKQVVVFAPATVANVGPGYDILGLALTEPGDRVIATRRSEPGIRLLEVRGESAPPATKRNTAYVAAQGVADHLRLSFGVDLILEKGLPVGSGLGSSGASAVAAAVGINALAGTPLSPSELLPFCAEAERVACGAAHQDNVAPALLGGVVMVRPDGAAIRIATELAPWLAMVTPEIVLPTRVARAAIPEAIPLKEVVYNNAQLASLVYGLATNDLSLIGRALDDRIVEPRRAGLIPGFAQVKAAALKAGACGCSISGAGPSIFAFCGDEGGASTAKDAMVAALKEAGLAHRAWISPVDAEGARIVDGC